MNCEITQESLCINYVDENDLSKKYQFKCTDSEVLQATINKQEFHICMVFDPQSLARILTSFQSDLEEITLIARPADSIQSDNVVTTSTAQSDDQAVQLHSFYDPTKGHVGSSIHTQVSINVTEIVVEYIHNYKNSRGQKKAVDVTFNLKDLKTFLFLCQSLNSNIAISITTPNGKPMLAELRPKQNRQNQQEYQLPYYGEIVLATLLDSRDPQQFSSIKEGKKRNQEESVQKRSHQKKRSKSPQIQNSHQEQVSNIQQDIYKVPLEEPSNMQTGNQTPQVGSYEPNYVKGTSNQDKERSIEGQQSTQNKQDILAESNTSNVPFADLKRRLFNEAGMPDFKIKNENIHRNSFQQTPQNITQSMHKFNQSQQIRPNSNIDSNEMQQLKNVDYSLSQDQNVQEDVPQTPSDNNSPSQVQDRGNYGMIFDK